MNPLQRLRLTLFLGVALATGGCGHKVLYLTDSEGESDWLQVGGAASAGSFRATGPYPPLRLLWQQRMDGAPLGGSILSGRLALTLTKTSTLHAFDRKSGHAVAKMSLDDAVCAPPAVAGDFDELLVFAELGRQPKLRAIDRRTGESRWQFDGVACAAIVISGDTLFAALENGRLLALSTAEGKELWHWDMEGRPLTPPAAYRGDVLVGDSKGTLTALDAVSGEPRWQSELGASVRSQPVIGAGRVFVATGAGEVHGLEALSGERLWSVRLGGLPTPGMSLNPHVLSVGCVDHYIYGLDPQTGRVVWKFETESVVRSTPASTESTVYAGSNDGSVYAIDSQTGGLKWKYELAEPIVEPFVLSSDALIVATETGSLYAFGR